MTKIILRLLLGVAVGMTAGATITGTVLASEAGRFLLETAGSLGVCGAAFAGGVAASAAAPRGFELFVAAVSVFGGSFARLLAYGTSFGSQITAEAAGGSDGGFPSLAASFLADGGWLLVSAVVGGWLVARLRRRLMPIGGGRIG